MSKANGSGTENVNYTYDAAGHRIAKEHEMVVEVDGEVYRNGSTAKYTYLGDTLTEMQIINVDESIDTFHFTYDATGPMSMTFCGAEYFYLKNAQGDVTGIVNAAGTQVVAYTYDAWGKLLSTTGTMAGSIGTLNPLRYRGYVYDTETGLYYLNSRYYNPETGRFINADGYVSTGQGIVGNNMFAYCGNNPVKRLDSTGELFFGAIVSGVLGAISGGLSAARNGENVIVGAVIGGLVGATIGLVGGVAATALKAAKGIVAATKVVLTAAAVSGAVYAGGDVMTQYTNYRLQDKSKRENAKKGIVTSRGSTENGQSQVVADRAYNAETFSEYVDTNRLGAAVASGVIFGAISASAGAFLSTVGNPNSPILTQATQNLIRDAVTSTEISCFQFLFDSGYMKW